ncbi:MAG: hypothetical protein SGARI_002512 [Bacillariaceae sp.]
MKFYAKQIAPQLAAFHLLRAPCEDILPRPETTSTIYETIDAWLQESEYLLLSSSSSSTISSVKEIERALLARLSEEWIWLKEQLAAQPQPQLAMMGTTIQQAAYAFIRRITVTHMDCQPLNILVDVNAPVPRDNSSSSNGDNNNNDDVINDHIQLRLIDFEYAGFNPAAADIANTFCEYCEMSNLKANYELEYPTAAQQDDFFWYYCRAYGSGKRSEFAIPDDRHSDEWKVFSATLQQEVGRFSLLSHLGWAVWSLVKSKEEDGVDFDYIFYANHRMDGYEWGKKKFFAERYKTAS